MKFKKARDITRPFFLKKRKLNPKDLFADDWKTTVTNEVIKGKIHHYLTISSKSLGFESLKINFHNRYCLGNLSDGKTKYTLTALGFATSDKYDEAFQKIEQVKLFQVEPESGDFLIRGIDESTFEKITTIFFEQSYKYRFSMGSISIRKTQHRHILLLDGYFTMQKFSKKRDIFVSKLKKTELEKKECLNAINSHRLSLTAFSELPFSKFSEVNLEQRDISLQKFIKVGKKHYINAEMLDYRLSNYFCEINLDKLSQILKDLFLSETNAHRVNIYKALITPTKIDASMFDHFCVEEARMECIHVDSIDKVEAKVLIF